VNRLGPDDDETEVTAAQVCGVVERLAAAGHWREGETRRSWSFFDAGYDVTRLAYLLADLPMEVLGRLMQYGPLCWRRALIRKVRYSSSVSRLRSGLFRRPGPCLRSLAVLGRAGWSGR
jgi:hypothetical protein